MKGGKAQVLYRDSSSLADTEILKKKKEKKKILAMREILLLPRRKSSKSTSVRAEIRGVEIAVCTWRSTWFLG